MDRSRLTSVKLLLIAIAIGFVVTLPMSGCTSTRDGFIEAGYAPAYADGDDDGHLTGYYAARGNSTQATKDDQRYDADAEYQRGWDDGYAVAVRDYRLRH